MPQTGNNLIDACASELNRTDINSTGSNASDAQGLLNDTLRDLFNRYTFSWRVLDPPATIPAVVGQKMYDISSVVTNGVQDIYTVILDTASTTTRPLNSILLKTFLDRWANVDYIGTTFPADFAKIDKTKFYVAPRPSSTWNFLVYYTQLFVNITDFTQNIGASDRALEVIKIGLLARMYRWTHEYPTASGFFAAFEKKIQELIDQDKEDPSRIFEMRPAVFGDRPISVDYWKSPFVRGV